MPTMLWRIEGTVLAAVHGREDPTDAEWTAYLTSARGPTRYTGTLVVTDGGGPNALQRKQLEDLPELRDLPVAVVTASRAARGIVTAIGWFGKAIKAFSPQHLPEALRYLRITPAEATRVCTSIDEMKAELARTRR
jgi:hypothetical protein